MENSKLREIVADAVGKVHGNPHFVQQIRNGDQDDGPYMQSAFAVRDWFLNELLPKPEEEVDG